MTAVAALVVLVFGGALPSSASARSPLVAAPLWVDPSSPAAAQADSWAASRPADAARMRQLARTPQATWLGSWSGNVRSATRGVVARAGGRMPVLVTYAIPGRDCSGGYSAGGLTSPRAYRAWVRAAAAGLGTRRATVIVEPDALADLDCLTPTRRAERLAMLRFAVRTFAARPRVAVYLDAGHSGWLSATKAASLLRRAGVQRADGFALNVSNYRWNRTELAHGQRVLRALGSPRGMGFVVDTSRNGRGPAPDAQWCNPAGRRVGTRPRTRSLPHGLHAWLWVKRPGESDGTCNGGPAAGTWWPSRALDLMRERALPRAARSYPWHTSIPATTFWVGERFQDTVDGSQVCSAYDSRWQYSHFRLALGVNDSAGCTGAPTGGCDALLRDAAGPCDGTNAVGSLRTPANGYFPVGLPEIYESPFYLDVPYDDLNDSTSTETTGYARRCTDVPWANDPGYAGRCTDRAFSYLKNRFVELRANGATCFGQVEDAGPADSANGSGNYADHHYVFGSDDARPANRAFGGAGLDVSPALGACLGGRFNEHVTVSWRFVERADVPSGPWLRIVTTSQPG